MNVTRTGDTSGTSSVDYTTLDEAPGVGHASQVSDYEIALGTLTFARRDLKDLLGAYR